MTSKSYDNSSPVKPNFICIGAPKSGTSWIYENLKTHPEIWLPPAKEIHFFNMQNNSWWNFIFADSWMNKMWRAEFASKVNYYNFKHRRGEMLWYLKFYLKKRNYNWYKNLFKPAQNLTTGDITPTYAILSAQIISNVKLHFPKIKIIYIIRNPAYRTWSQAVMLLANFTGRKLEDIPEKEFYDFFTNKNPMLQSNYSIIINNWKKNFPDKQFLLLYFDELTSNPKKLLNRIYNFLEVSEQILPDENKIKQAVNVGIANTIPIKFKKFLMDYYLPDLISLKKMLDGPNLIWLKEAKLFLE